MRSEAISHIPTITIQQIIRRKQLRQMVPLADTTIYDMERRGEFPRRFFLTSRCVVWVLSEVQQWLAQRRQERQAVLAASGPFPDVRKRKRRPVKIEFA